MVGAGGARACDRAVGTAAAAHLEGVVTSAALDVWRTQLRVEVDAEVAPELLERLLWQQATQLDEAASRFRPDSEVSVLQRAAGRWTPIGPVLAEVLRLALDAAAATGGLVHPGLGAAVAAAGYDAWAGQPAAVGVAGAASAGLPLPWQRIELREGCARIPPGMVLDLGAVGKAWLADSLARALHAATGAAVVADMGGDLRVISPQRPTTVWLDPQAPGAQPIAVAVADAGVATSGLARRRWAGGHHIIDPRNGRPAQTPWWSVSVIAADAVAANIAATAAIVMGEAAPDWLAEHRLPARLVTAVGSEARTCWPHDAGRAA